MTGCPDGVFIPDPPLKQEVSIPRPVIGPEEARRARERGTAAVTEAPGPWGGP